MVIYELQDGSGIGNQLWGYVVCRLIAEHKGVPFSIMGQENWKGRGFMEIDFGVAPIIENYYFEPENIENGHSMWGFDPELYNIPDNTKIDGNFQAYQYLEGHEDKIREWIKFDAPYETDYNVIHFRAGDYLTTDVFLPKSYYEEAMKIIGGEFVCVSDQPEIAEKFLGVECISAKDEDKFKASHHFGGDIAVDFSYLVNAKNLIIPNSSFGWWSAFLNTKKEKVIAPLHWAGYNRGYWQTKDIKTSGFIYV